MKYRLNYDWNGLKKGQIFISNDEGEMQYERKKKGFDYWFRKEEVDLLLLSGALTEVKEKKEPCSCPKGGIDGNGRVCTKCDGSEWVESH